MSGNLLHTLYDRREPDSEAFRFADAEARTTRDVVVAVGKTAKALSDAGVRRGDRISFKLEKSEEVIFLAHACLQLGAVLHPLNTAYTDFEIAYLVQDADPRLLVCHPNEAERLATLCGVKVETLGPGMAGSLGSAARGSAALIDFCPVASTDVAALLYTSGTTGRSKGACITHGNLAESARALIGVWQLQAHDCLLHALPLYHAHGLLTAINCLLASGGAIVFLPGFEAGVVLDALPLATVMMGVPTHYARLVHMEGLAQACRSLRLAISGSAPLPFEISDRFLAVTGKKIIERYGSTETAIVTALPFGERDRTGYVGWPLPGVSIRVSDDAGVKSSRDAIGGLEIRGHNVCAGYWRRPDSDSEAFTPDGWFVSGDIARIDATGCVQLLGRSKDLIISGGLNVYPKEVEDALDALVDGGESAVFGVPHPDFGEAVVAVVEGAGSGIEEAALLRTLRLTLAAYKVPKAVIATSSIPRNRLGKVLKNELRAAHRHLFISGPQPEK